MENKRKGKWMPRRVISWILTVIMVVGTFAYGGIPGARNVYADYGDNGDGWFFYFDVRFKQTGDDVDRNPILTKVYDRDSSGNQDDDETNSYEISSWSVTPNDTIVQPDTAYTYSLKVQGSGGADPMPVSAGAKVYWNYIDYTTTSPSHSDSGLWCYYQTTLPMTCSSYSPATAVSNFIYDGTEHVLLNNDATQSSNRVTIYYKLNNGSWTTDRTAIKAKNAGTYTIYWKVEGEGLDSRKTNSGSYSVTISKLAVTVTPDANQQKTYGLNDPTLAYTTSPAIPAADATSGVFTSGKLGREEGEDYEKTGYAYTLGTLQTSNSTNYTISLSNPNNSTFMINRKQITDADVTKALDSTNVTDSIYKYTYNGEAIEPAISIKYTTKEISGSNSLVFNQDYVVDGDDTVIEYINQDSDKPYIINLRGIGNYQGVTSLNWKVMRKNFGTVTAAKSTTTYDGKDHSITVNLPNNAGTDIKVTYIAADDQSVDYTTAWDANLASDTNPAYKDASTHYIYWRAHSDDKDGSGEYIYNDQFGVAELTINKKVVTLVADNKEKTYDKDASTDPELTYVDYTDQLVAGESLSGFKISRELGQNAGNYEISFPVDAMNALEANKNYDIKQTTGTFTINRRKISISADNQSKTYSDPNPEFTLVVEDAEYGEDGKLTGNTGLLKDDKINGSVQFADSEGHIKTMNRHTDAGEYTIVAGGMTNDNNPNYNITFTTGSMTINPKNIKTAMAEENPTVAVLYNGERSNAIYTYTGATIKPAITLTDIITDETETSDEYVKYGREGEVTHPDYVVKGDVESALFGVHEITVKGLGNYTGEVTGAWAIFPYIDQSVEYNGETQYPVFDSIQDSKYTVKYSQDDPGANPTEESYASTSKIGYKDVNIVEGKVAPYNIYYGIVLDPSEFGTNADGSKKVIPGTAKFTITPKAVTVTVPGPAISKVYDGKATATFADQEVETGVKSEKIKLTSLHGTYMSGTGEDAVADANVGTAKPIVISASDYAKATTVAEGSDVAGKPSNYNITYACTNSIGDITLKPVTVVANYDATKVYDGTTAVYKTVVGATPQESAIVAADATVTITNPVEGETFSVQNFAATYDTKHVGDNKTINYSGTFTVTDADGKALALSNYGYIDTDDTSTTYNTLIPFADNTTVTNVIGTGTASITQAPVNFYQTDAGKVEGAMNIKLSVDQKIYDGSNQTAVKAEITALGEDQIEYNLTGEYESKDALVENDKPKVQNITVGGTLSGKENTDTLVSDYAAPVYPKLSGTILPRGFNLNMQADDKVYDGKTDAKNVRFNLTEIPNQMSESDAWKAETVLISNLVGTYADKNVGDDKPLDITAKMEITGQDALLSNYYVVTGTGTIIDLTEDLQVTDVTSSITPKAVTVTVDNKSKTYGQSDPALTWTASGIVEGETKDDLGITVSRAAGENAGTYKISTTKSANKNYSVTYKDGTFTINKAAASSTPIASKITTKASEGSGNNGAISGVNDTMEYSTDGGKTWKSVPKGTSIVGGLPAGTVLIRTKATANRNASGAIKVTIAKGGSTPVPYTGEWKKGQWYDVNGGTSYKPKGGWKQDTTGWWYEDSSGWYPKSQWQKIDGYWYYFDSRGYMASSEWINGWWVDKDGAWRYKPRGSWKQNATGWWYEDTSGWYPTSQWQKIDGKWYYFEGTGYMASNTIIDVWTVGADGAWVE